MSPVTSRSYLFTDFIRFVAMCAIIFQHSFIVERSVLFTDSDAVLVFYFMKILAKIGSISFFIVSGYLLCSALERYSSREYLNKRVKNIFRPYLLFFLLFLIIECAGAFFGHQRITQISDLPIFFFNKVLNTLFFTSYWFIFNYFISVSILLAFRKYLYKPWFGAVLFGCTLVYSANVHLQLFVSHHTAAFLGFVFFLWLGANLAKNEERFWSFIDNTPYWKILLVISGALFLNYVESIYLLLNEASSVDSSLKITNIVYSLSMVMLLCKTGQHVKLKFFNPREETYPLYLIHPVFLKLINYGLFPLLPAVASALTIDNAGELNEFSVVLFQIIWFVGIYFISLLSVRLILHSRFRWIFGKTEKLVIAPSTRIEPIKPDKVV